MHLLVRFLIKTGLIKYFNFTFRNRDGFTIPVLGGVGAELLVYDKEVWMNTILRKFSTGFTDKIFFDVGVNIGQTLLKVFHLNASQQYVGIEPNPSCLNYVYRLMEENKFSNVTIFPVALSDKTGMVDLQLYHSSTIDSSASIVKGFRADQVATLRKVPAVGAREIQLNSRVGMIKIDVEGAELEVIRNLESTIEKERPFIICEVLPVYDHTNLFRLNRQLEVEKILKHHNFGIVRLDTSGSGSFIESIGVHSDMEQSNYLFYPLEKRNEVEQRLNSK